ncbi:hypothetical protein QIA37_02295 [Borrelia sp. CA_690]|uniref:Uncharacterized protein n=1 Tax=Borrelia maritima TaxID=2761123 RepID=A0A5J6WEQ6_9SPIR|nr:MULTISPECIES: hypothetical protein [Borrelia]QFI14479.1 hypothetical protein DB723_01725 [Borrelia maritima]WKC84334.1 hypothetical protein QIA37_02295 [Borrelia sp. CA_690]
MNNFMIIKKIILIAILLISLSCSKNKNIVVLTDNKTIPFYINQFNIENKLNFIIKFRNNIDLQTIKKENAQIIISKNIGNTNINNHLKSIKINYNPDYPVLKHIFKQFNYKIIPLSFDVPILIYKNTHSIKKYINVKDLKEEYEKFIKDGKFFISPYISENLFYVISEINGVRFSFEKNKLNYNEKKILKMSEYFSSFLNPKQMDLQKDFFNKYSYLKLNKILLNKKSLLITGLGDLTFYNKLNEKEKAEIKFSYLINNNNEVVISSPNFIGILETSILTKKFINWILDKNIQKTLIRFNNQPQSFGLANGFTPYKELNLKIKHSIDGISPFIVDETKINSYSYVLNKKTIEKENLLINEWFFAKIKNPKNFKN